MKHLINIGITLIICSCQSPSNNSSEEIIKVQQEFLPDSILQYSTGKFPEKWDLNRELRKSDKQILSWKHIKDDRGKEFKFCITYKTKIDSLGKENIYIEELRSEPPNFDKWQTAMISYAPDPSNPNSIGYHDWLLRSFDHKPSREEIYKMLDEFTFKLKQEGWMTIEAGIDYDLWIEHFGFNPEDYLNEKNSL